MAKNQTIRPRIAVIALLVLLAIQYEFGMAINLSDLASISPIPFTAPSISSTLNQAGFAAVVHASLGTILIILSLTNLGLALASKIRSVQVFGVLGFLSMCLAASSGLLFVLSGFQNDGYSHGMATNFILTFGFAFLELYFLKPPGRTETS